MSNTCWLASYYFRWRPSGPSGLVANRLNRPNYPDDVSRETISQLTTYFAGLLTAFTIPLFLAGIRQARQHWPGVMVNIIFGTTIGDTTFATTACTTNVITVIYRCHRVESKRVQSTIVVKKVNPSLTTKLIWSIERLLLSMRKASSKTVSLFWPSCSSGRRIHHYFLNSSACRPKIPSHQPAPFASECGARPTFLPMYLYQQVILPCAFQI